MKVAINPKKVYLLSSQNFNCVCYGYVGKHDKQEPLENYSSYSHVDYKPLFNLNVWWPNKLGNTPDMFISVTDLILYW